MFDNSIHSEKNTSILSAETISAGLGFAKRSFDGVGGDFKRYGVTLVNS